MIVGLISSSTRILISKFLPEPVHGNMLVNFLKKIQGVGYYVDILDLMSVECCTQ